MSPQEQQRLDAFVKYRTAGEQHATLAEREGTWNVVGNMWQAEDAPAETFTATSRIKAIMDGRYIVERFEGALFGEEFEGVGIFGFDNLTQSYVGVWLDNFGTGIHRLEGQPCPDGDIIHWTGQQPNVTLDAYEKMQSVGRQLSKDEMVYTSYGPSPDGEGVKQMEPHYTRSMD